MHDLFLSPLRAKDRNRCEWIALLGFAVSLKCASVLPRRPYAGVLARAGRGPLPAVVVRYSLLRCVRPSRTALFTPALARTPCHRDCKRLTARMDPRPEPRFSSRPEYYQYLTMNRSQPRLAGRASTPLPGALKRRFPSGAESWASVLRSAPFTNTHSIYYLTPQSQT